MGNNKGFVPMQEEAINVQGAGMLRRVKQPLFERDIMAPGADVAATLTATYFPDEQSLNNACKYLDWLQKHGLEREERIALLKINGNKSIHFLGTKYAVQAHGGLFWDSEASKEDKKYLAKMQEKDRRDGEGEEER